MDESNRRPAATRRGDVATHQLRALPVAHALGVPSHADPGAWDPQQVPENSDFKMKISEKSVKISEKPSKTHDGFRHDVVVHEANLLYAESLLYMDGPEPLGESPHLAAQGLQMTRRVPREVLTALERTWPLEVATRRYQDVMGLS